ncbi:DNA repair and rombination protein RadB [Candidatus Nitrosocosmicus arcticus]|uniref:DNA repair and rombination protein RadB n=1 Tax=Candidatus Nitrosocosmicus arcticus TaxID=2035267 RepID=A0A557SST7_9ARCH|nr:DNA repair and rombination protein RadB [Candidatus Nitrosocosmicus arcticus]
MTQNGTLIELVGKKGAGRTHLVYLICSLNSIRSKKTLYLDGSGNFRPEVIYEFLKKIANVSGEELRIFLKKITYQRIYEVYILINLLKKIKVLDIDCVIINDVIPLFLYNQNKNIRQEVRRFVRELALIAITKKISIVFTSTLVEKFEENSFESINYELFYHEIIRYVHIKAIIQRRTQNMIECTFIHPKNLIDSKLSINLDKFEQHRI